jgi:predicted RNA polymerase sigma factor
MGQVSPNFFRAVVDFGGSRVSSGTPCRPPTSCPSASDAVLSVIHLLYATGHTAPSGDDLVRDDLTGRALDLARMVRLLLPTDREAAGLLALLLVHHARRATRTDAQGRLLRLEEQDRSAWDRELIAEADRLVVAALRAGRAGRFTLQAAIAAVHAQAATRADLLHRLGRDAEAADAYRAALALSDNAAEQEFLAERVRSTQPAS